jgi:hypothetical protein
MIQVDGSFTAWHSVWFRCLVWFRCEGPAVVVSPDPSRVPGRGPARARARARSPATGLTAVTGSGPGPRPIQVPGPGRGPCRGPSWLTALRKHCGPPGPESTRTAFPAIFARAAWSNKGRMHPMLSWSTDSLPFESGNTLLCPAFYFETYD